MPKISLAGNANERQFSRLLNAACSEAGFELETYNGAYKAVKRYPSEIPSDSIPVVEVHFKTPVHHTGYTTLDCQVFTGKRKLRSENGRLDGLPDDFNNLALKIVEQSFYQR